MQTNPQNNRNRNSAPKRKNLGGGRINPFETAHAMSRNTAAVQRENQDNAFIRAIKKIEIEPAFTVLLSFLLLQIFRLFDMLITNKTFENIVMIPFQLLVFLLPAFLFARHKNRQNPFDYLLSLRVRTPKLYQLPLIVTAIALMTFGNMLISLIFAGSDSLSDGFTLYNIFVSRTDGKFFSVLYVILTYALIPAFCEELVFRGILCREYERYNVLCGIIASSLFFAMLHFDVYLFPVYFFSGMILSLTMYATGSLPVAIIVHGAFNLICLFGQSYLNAFYTITGGTQGLFIFIISMLTLLCMALFCGFASKCYGKRAAYSSMKNQRILPKANKITHIVSKLLLTPFAIASFVVYIVAVLVDYFI